MVLKALKGKFICMMAAFAVLAGETVTSSAASTPTTIKTLPLYYDYDEEDNRHYYDNDGNEISYSDDDEDGLFCLCKAA